MAKIVHHWKDPGPAARLTLWAIAASALVTVAYGAWDIVYPSDRPVDVGMSTQVYDLISNSLSAMSALVLIPGAMWLYRVSANAHAWEATMKHSPASAWVWFAIPVAHLFVPFRVLSEIFRVSGARSRRSLNIFWVGNVISLGSYYGFMTWAILSIRDGSLDAPLWANLTTEGLALVVHPLFAWVVIDLTRTQQDTTRFAEAFSDGAQPA